MIQENFTSAEIYAQVRTAMRPDDMAVADTEREFWKASAAFDAHFSAARQHLDAMKAIGA
jgi:spermidine synthase